MTELEEIIERIRKLSENDRQHLLSLLTVQGETNSDLHSFLAERRLSRGLNCPKCRSASVKRNGHKDGIQRYMCLNCHKTFSSAANTILASTKKKLLVWDKYIECMMSGLPIRRTAEKCGISKNTAFAWRHKILDALRDRADKVRLAGIVECDETFFQVSYKGNHAKSKTFTMPREAHHRGGETHTRGLSKEKLCVPCAVNRDFKAIAKPAKLGRVSAEALRHTFGGRISTKGVICTDGANAYDIFADESNIRLVSIKGGKCGRGLFHIQHINGYHSTLKMFISRFRGVSSKYLENYLVWNSSVNWSEKPWAEREREFRLHSLTADKTVLIRDLPCRPALPILTE